MELEENVRESFRLTYWLGLNITEQQQFLRATRILSHNLDKAGTYQAIQEKFRDLLAVIPNLRGIFAGTPDELRIFVVARWRVKGIALALVLADGAVELHITQLSSKKLAVIVQVMPATRQLEPIAFAGPLNEVCTLLEQAAKIQDVGLIESNVESNKED